MKKIWPFTKGKTDLIYAYLAHGLRYIYLLLIIPFYGRVLGPDGYGILLAAFSLMYLVWVFVNWGFSIAGMRDLSITKSSNFNLVNNKYLSAKFVLSLVGFLFGLIFIQLSSLLALNFSVAILSLLLGIVMAFNMGWYYIGTGRSKISFQIEILSLVLNLTLILFFINDNNDIWLIPFFILLSNIICILLSYYLVRDEITPLQLKIVEGVKTISESKTLFLFSAVGIIVNSSSTYILSIFANATEVGYFGSAERLITAGISLMVPLLNVFLPKFIKLFNENHMLAYKHIQKFLLLSLVFNLLISLIVYLNADLIINLIFGDSFQGSVAITKCFVLIFPISGTTIILTSFLLIPLHHEENVTKITIGCAIFSLLITFIFAKYDSGIGVAISRVIGEFVLSFSLLIYCHKIGLLKNILKKYD